MDVATADDVIVDDDDVLEDSGGVAMAELLAQAAGTLQAQAAAAAATSPGHSVTVSALLAEAVVEGPVDESPRREVAFARWDVTRRPSLDGPG